MDDLKIIAEKDNQLLKRKEIKAIVGMEKNPTMNEAVKFISEHFHSGEENIAVQSIKGKFGRHTFLISASIYADKGTKERTEPKKKVKGGKPAPATEKPAE